MIARKKIPILFMLLSLIAARGCDEPTTKPQSLPTTSMKVGNRQMTLEIAADDATREIGLMYRDSMPPDHGMIFVFPDEARRIFWMKNTRIPLDIIYIAGNGKIVSIRSMKPYDLTGIDSGGAAKFAIEVNPGIPTDAGLKTGDTIDVPAPLAAAAR